MSPLGTHPAEQASSAPGTGLEVDTLARRVAADILRISSAVGLAQVLAVAAAPLLTRLYSPEAFGQFAFFNAVVTILAPLTSMRYEWALPLPQDESRALDLLALSLMLVLASSVATAILAPFVWPLVIGEAEIGDGIALVPVAILALGLHTVVTDWLVRDRAFPQIARVRFVTTGGAVVCQIALGRFFGGPRSLILGMIGGYLLGLALAAYQCRRALSKGAGRLRLRGVPHVAAEYRSFALITAPSGVVNAIGSQIPSLMLPSLYGLAVNGQFSLARRVLAQPTVLLGQAVNQVLWGNSARLLVERPAHLWPLFVRLNVCLITLMAPSLVLIWFGGDIFAFVFGSGWEQAGEFAGIMIIASFLGFAAQGTTCLHVYRLNHWMCAWEISQLILVAGVLGAASWMRWPPMTCIIGITAALAVAQIMLLALNTVAVRRMGLRTAVDHAGAAMAARREDAGKRENARA